MSSLIIEPGARVLFQGDSITDAGRNREDPASMGFGYANFASAWISAKYPDHKIEFVNRGIGGNTVIDLETRWEPDCIDIKPDWLSILIGINDCGREISGVEGHTLEGYDDAYRRILDRARAAPASLPSSDAEARPKLIVMEPFLLPCREDGHLWQDKLLPRIQVARAIARDYSAIYVPLDGLFAAAATRREPVFWTLPDGVHPTQAGHALIAQAWIRAVGG